MKKLSKRYLFFVVGTCCLIIVVGYLRWGIHLVSGLAAYQPPFGASDQVGLPLIVRQDTATSTHTPTLAPSPTLGTPLPDLYAYSWHIKYYGCPWGDPGLIEVPVSNIGEAEAGPFHVMINRTAVPVSFLAVGDIAWSAVYFDAGPVGGVLAHADDWNEVQELDESNNGFRILFTAPPPCVTESPMAPEP